MGCPVVHFEINANRPAKLKDFYERAFDWKIAAADADGYSEIDTEGVCAGTGVPGINGGIGSADVQGGSFVTFYVQVPDVAEALAAVEALGGETALPLTEVPGGVTFAIFRDPAGNRVGLVKA